jgi:uncharacterized protein YqgV (UPF0045/DUF77 family)
MFLEFRLKCQREVLRLLFLPMKNLAENTQEIIDEAAEGGLKYLVAAHFPISNGKEINDAISILNKAAESTKKAGIQLVYHNGL